jgi:branched-chain amino acid transport system ATP-binding protein
VKSLRRILVNHLLEVEDVDIFYGDAQAVWDVSFHVDKKKIIALLGANGAGKSTLLNTISSVIQPSKGEILFSGKYLVELKPEEVVAVGISHVPEGRRLFSRLTVLENLELGAYPANTRPFLKESQERAFDLFPALKERIHQPAGTLSGGEQQMLAIARGLMARPILLMLDEPSLGLAPIFVSRLFETIQALNEAGVTILLVEQNVHQALEIADYAYVLQNGTLKMEGQPETLLNDSAFQHAFLGMMG